MQQKITFLQGVNSDTTNELLPAEQSRYRLNVRVLSSNNSTVGAVETLNGNTLVSYTLPVGGTFTVIGSEEYTVQKKIYYFVHCTTAANNIILQYDSVTNVVTQVFQDSILNFNSSYLITSIDFIEIDEDNHLMYWTDNYNEPRKLNIEKAIYYSAGNYTLGYKSPFDPEILYRIKPPMLLSPVSEYGNDANVTVNRINNKLFQFKVQFVYDDNEVSAWSPISKTSFVTYENDTYSSLITGVTGQLIGFNYIQPNIINVTVDTGIDIVTKIRIAAKESDKTDFLLVTELNKEALQISSNTTYVYTFDNGGVYNPINIAESIKLFDNVPKLCQTHDIISGNRIADGNITEGFDPTPVDLKIDYSLSGTDYAYKGLTLTHATLVGTFLFDEIVVDAGGARGYLINFTLNGATDNIVVLPINSIAFTAGTLTGETSGATETIASVASLTNPPFLPINALKRGGSYTYGIIYYDHGNRSSLTNINTGSFEDIQNNGAYGTELFVPFYTTPITGALTITIEYNFYYGVGPFVPGEVVTQLETGATGVVVSDTVVIPGISGILIVSNIVGGNAGWFVFLNTILSFSGATSVGVVSASYTYDPYKGSFPMVSWNIYNEPPSWATHYQIARTKNTSLNKYLQFVANTVDYLDIAGNVQSYPSSSITQVKINISNITNEFLDANPGSKLVYDFTTGDRIRFIANPTLQFLSNYWDFEIGSYDAGTGNLFVQFPKGYGTFPGTGANKFQNVVAGCWFEIYTPQLVASVSDRITYEFACGNDVVFDSVNNKYVHNGDVQDQIITTFTSSVYTTPPTFTASGLPTGHGLLVNDDVKILTSGYSVYGTVSSVAANSVVITTTTTLVGTWLGIFVGTISKCAKGIFLGGDTFYRPRIMPYSAGASSVTALVEDANFSDLYLSKGYDYGRPNRIDPEYKEINRESTIFYSEPFIPETFINGLSSVYDTSFQTYEDKNGGIYKLYAEDYNLNVFQELKIGALLVNQAQLNSTAGSSIVSQATEVLPEFIRYYAGEFGIGKHPESFAVYGNAKYGIDVNRGVVWRLSIDGLTPISKTAFMDNYITDKCQEILGHSSKVNIFGGYDSKFNEYILAFNPYGAVSAETLAWNERANAWSTFYSFNPETICTNGTGIVSFKGGKLYTHNTNTIQNNFYGEQYYAEIWVTLNADPSNVKVFEALSQETNDAWECYSITTPNGQETNLLVSDFQMKENLQYAPLWRDVNTPNVTNPLLEGDPMRDTTFLCKFRRTNTDYNKIFAINLNYIISNLHNR